ncbi:hypothetical protein, partial [Xanthomarina sp.]|uniref:hypothetical protein n=1 Tax=Xanthomarina sp. TaxID=1931211 RepID=UPI002CA6B526
AGNTGTEQDFLDSLIGADGADGADGTDGVDGTNGTDGISAYEEWIAAGNTGTEQDFLDSLIGADGADGTNGADGISAYEEWIAAGNTGTEQDFLDSLIGADGADGVDGTNGTNGADGISAYEEWIAAGNTGTEQDFLDSLIGADGVDGADGADGADGVDGTNGTNGADGISAYEEWIAAGNTGTEQDFLDSLVGADGADGVDGTDGTNGTNGADGISAYEEWIAAGNTGTEQDFLDSLIGADGADGADGVVDPKDLTAIGTSITVTNGIGATLLDTSIEVTDGGITAIKVNENVAGLGLVKNPTTNALDVQANNGLNVDTTADAVQLGGALIKPTTIATSATNTLALTGLQNGDFEDNILVVDRTSGVIKQLKAAMPTFFYMPSVIIYTAADQVPGGDVFGTIDLYAKYQQQFGSPVASNPGAITSLPVLPRSELDYFITFYDDTVFANVAVSNMGVLTYTVLPTAEVSLGSFMNIVFSVKP